MTPEQKRKEISRIFTSEEKSTMRFAIITEQARREEIIEYYKDDPVMADMVSHQVEEMARLKELRKLF